MNVEVLQSQSTSLKLVRTQALRRKITLTYHYQIEANNSVASVVLDDLQVKRCLAVYSDWTELCFV